MLDLCVEVVKGTLVRVVIVMFSRVVKVISIKDGSSNSTSCLAWTTTPPAMVIGNQQKFCKPLLIEEKEREIKI